MLHDVLGRFEREETHILPVVLEEAVLICLKLAEPLQLLTRDTLALDALLRFTIRQSLLIGVHLRR